MTLGDFIKNYRKEHNISMDKFSDMSGISKSYISLLEKNKHPKTGKPITPSINCIHQVSKCTNTDFNTLFAMLDGCISLSGDMKHPVGTSSANSVSSSSVTFNISDEEMELIRQFRKSPHQDSILALLGLKRKDTNVMAM